MAVSLLLISSLGSVDQIRRVFDDNLGIIFVISP